MTKVAKFQGAYVQDVRDALVASIVSAEHALLIGAPGWGKTAIARRVAERVTDGEYVFLRLDGSTPPEKVAGMPDPAKLLASPPTIEYMKSGTVYDLDARAIILDEIGRPMDAIFDILLDPLNRVDIDPDDAPVVWGTTNFMPSSDRTEALRDRIAMWIWVNPGQINVGDIVAAHLDGLGNGLQIDGKLPTWKEIEEIKKARPGNKARSAVSDLIEMISQEASQSGYVVHPRRISQWSRILFRTGMYWTGSDDFDVVPKQASKVLQYCWPTLSQEEWNSWREIAEVAGDPVGTAINEVLSMSYNRFKQVRDAGGSGRAAASIQLGEALANAQRSLNDIGVEDPRIEEAMSQLTMAFASVVRGEDPIEMEV